MSTTTTCPACGAITTPPTEAKEEETPTVETISQAMNRRIRQRSTSRPALDLFARRRPPGDDAA
ncbi:MAG: hypothetical protein WKF86_05945 [Acidimicrobiales bacterium]